MKKSINNNTNSLNRGLEWRAAASLGLILIALMAIGLNLIPRPNSTHNAPSDTALNSNSSITFTESAFPTRLQTAPAPPPPLFPINRFTTITNTTSPNEVIEARDWPRLKPPPVTTFAELTRPVEKSIPIGAPHLAENIQMSFALADDFTGGRASLLEKIHFTPIAKTTLKEIILQKGETLSNALARAGIAHHDREAVAVALDKQIRIKRLRPGLALTVETAVTHSVDAAKDSLLIALKLAPEKTKWINVLRQEDNSFEAITEIPATTKRYMTISGTIKSSLLGSAEAQGMPRAVGAKFVNLFPFDVDFQRDIRRGDEFEAVFEVYYDALGQRVAYGDVVYGRLTWRNKSHEKAYYMAMIDGRKQWFDAKGQSAKRLLMKTPIDGARITSGFGKRRHPVLGYTKKHKGVDFGARRGTPIKAAGDGIIERANRFSSYGNYVKIKHANGYQTAYAHLKGFARGIKKGKRVRQGDIIGYVGTTGRSTGPHLHYEVIKGGKQTNPMSLKIPTGISLKDTELAAFTQERDWLDTLRGDALPQKYARK